MADENTAGRPKYKRSARNYLLDKHFQLKYTGFLMGIAVALSIVLGALLWRASTEVLEQARGTVEQNKRTVEQGLATVKQSEETVKRGVENIELSGNINKLSLSTIETCYANDQALLDSFKKGAAETDAELLSKQEKLEQDKKNNEAQSKALGEQASKVEADVQRLETNLGRLRVGFIVLLVLLVLAIGVAGIVFTHKIAGPIFKMKRLLREVGSGKLLLREKLRKGDELQHFFETFEQMVDQLRAKQQKRIGELDEILAKLEADGLDDKPAVKSLRELRSDMHDHLQA